MLREFGEQLKLSAVEENTLGLFMCGAGGKGLEKMIERLILVLGIDEVQKCNTEGEFQGVKLAMREYEGLLIRLRMLRDKAVRSVGEEDIPNTITNGQET
jgi:hypothetical protein